MLEDRLGSSKVEGLARATTLLREQAPRAAEFFNHDPRGAKLIEYFEGLNDTLQQERVHNQAEVSRLRDTVRHIRDAIAAQQTFARRSDFRQEVDFRALVDEALCMNEELIRESRVQVTVDLPPLPELRLNKSKIVQVLVNLIRNAVEAMQGQPPDGRRLRIAASPDADGGIEIEVQDTGAGFSDEVRANLFTHGFTTKPQGNGLGLHYCANAIREVGGHIAAQSPGPGRGATFRVRLPEAMPQPAAAST
jgi:signal transduction histidine kinase